MSRPTLRPLAAAARLLGVAAPLALGACASSPPTPAAPPGAAAPHADPEAPMPTPDDAHAHHGHHGHHGHALDQTRFDDASAWTAVFDDPARDAWQRPDEVLRVLVDRDDLAVADIGAGTGYFASRFARALPKGHVFGVDIAPKMVEHLNTRAREEGLANLEAHVAPPEDARLGALGRPLDLVFLCNTYHHVNDRTSYFREVRRHLAPGGRLAIVDFKTDSHRGPPAEYKLAAEAVVAELTAAGYALAARHDELLPDQYVLVFR